MGDSTAITEKGEGVILTPDPSALTRDLIAQQTAGLRELLHAEIQGETTAILARLNAMDKAVTVFQDSLTRVPTEVDKQVGGLRTFLEARVDGHAAAMETRLGGMDKAIVLLQALHDRIPAQMDSRVAHLHTLMNEKFETQGERFNGVQKQFQERDVRGEQSAAAGGAALKAALQAQKESAGDQLKALQASIDKSEAATTKLLEALGETLKTATSSQNEKLETLTRGLETRIVEQGNRLERMEAGGLGRAAAVTDQRATISASATLFGLAATLIIVLIAVATYFAAH